MSITSYLDLEVYRRSMSVLLGVHQMVRGFPDYEMRELGSQMRRASKSIPLNIVEGYGRKRSEKDFKYYLSNAMGSANEMVVSLEIAKLLSYADVNDCDHLINEYNEIGKMLNGLIASWKNFSTVKAI